MKHFQYIFPFLILVLGNSFVYCQGTEYYDISISVANPPGWGHRSEWYLKTNDTAVHKISKIDYDEKRTTTETTVREELSEKQINQFDSLFRLQEFRFKVSKKVIAAIKKDAHWYNLNDSDISNFFEKGDTVHLEMSDIPKDTLSIFTLDGAPFSIVYKMKRAGQDTVQYKVEGNFVSTSISNEEIQNWLAVYLYYKQNRIFSSVKEMNSFYGDKMLPRILFRFIKWRKDK